MLKKEYLAKLFVIFGVTTLIAWIVNFIVLIMPFQFKVLKWVYLLSQELSEKSIFPLLGILALITGVYLCTSAKEEGGGLKCKCAVWAERLSAVLSMVFFAGLLTMAVVYSLSIKPLCLDIKNQIDDEAAKVKSQIAMMSQSNPNIQQENIEKGIQDIDKRVVVEIKKANKDIVVNSVKILVGLISFAFAYLIFAVYLIKISLFKNKCCQLNTENQE